MKEMIDFAGQLLKDLTPVVEIVQKRSEQLGGNKDIRLFLADDEKSIVIGGDKVPFTIQFPLTREVERFTFGVVDGHFADLHRNDGGYWTYK